MRTLHNLLIALPFGLCLLLAGCGGDLDDLRKQIADIRARPGDRVDPLPEIKPAADDSQPAQLQIVPCEILLKPGQKQQLTARLFNSRGQFLKEEKAEFDVAGDGTVDDSGVFTAPADAGHGGTIVTGKVGDLTARARIRIVPPLPWKFDFEGLKDPPLSWVGARYRHVMREVDGSSAMVKITTIHDDPEDEE